MFNFILKKFRFRITKRSDLYINLDGKLCIGKFHKNWVINGLKKDEGNVFRSLNSSEYIVNKLESFDGYSIDFGFNKKYVNNYLGW